MTENIIESTFEEGKKRILESPFWSSFIISWLVVNWKVVYITLSLNSEKIDDKILYIEKLYDFSSLSAQNGIFHLAIIPFLTSVFAVWIVPYINREYLLRQHNNRKEDNRVLIDGNKDEEKLIESRKALLIKQEQEFNAQKKKLEAEYSAKESELKQKSLELESMNKLKPIESEREIWDREYAKLLNTTPNYLDELSNLIYDYQGDPTNYTRTNMKKIFEVNELIDLKENEYGRMQYFLTSKGKHFLRKETLGE